MIDTRRLLAIAVEDNIAWCSAVCSAHGSNETNSSQAWANLARSPPFYPNVITRREGAQDEVEELCRRLRKTAPLGNWGIKDSFGDLALADHGFERAVVGAWYGGLVSNDHPIGWRTVASQAELCTWEHAWGSQEEIVFPGILLEDERIKFWFKGGPDTIEAGFISFDSGFSLGISNWFSLKDETFAEMGILHAAALVARGQPVVCWSTDDLASEDAGLHKLGPLQVWISR